MKKSALFVLMALMSLFLTTGLALAGSGAGDGDGDGPIHDILGGNYFEYTGAVVSYTAGQGMVLALANEDLVTVYGVGPASFWEAAGIERPAIGEEVFVTGYAVDYNGEVRNILMTVTVGEDVLQLRDSETGLPLWRNAEPLQTQFKAQYKAQRLEDCLGTNCR